MAIIDVLNPMVVQQMIDGLGGKHLINSLVVTVQRLTQTTDTLSSNISASLAFTLQHLAQTTDTLSSDVSVSLASTVLLIENLTATTSALASDLHYLLQCCITLVVLLCLLTVLFIVRWCYAFSRDLRGVQHLKTA
ncbi:hypothetical protein DFH29DRAFT_1003906 [Suillus ampliporus]|nr:hypothetical protein DFH29DRAFT_1003906 [Suillus ampliporus]